MSDSGQKKIIQFNPDLFKVPEKKTKRSKKDPNTTAKIVPKTSPKHNKSLKSSVLRMIRNKQKESYDKMIREHKQSVVAGQKPAPIPNTHVQQFQSDFEESLNFANDFLKQQEQTTKINKTLKQYPNANAKIEQVSTNLPEDVFENVFAKMPVSNVQQVVLNRPPAAEGRHANLPPQPKWGCLKGGNLMTYRNFHNKTVRTPPPPLSPPSPSTPPFPPMDGGKSNDQIPSPILLEKMKRSSEKEKKIRQMPQLKYKKRKKTLKRTYTVGRSKYFPKIGVLISNKTIRNKTTEKIQLLKQTPIQEVRKFLIKRGFIRIGTPAPNDLLRKMYESVQLVCGEIQNHNPENLLYNFVNDK
jgi:hypothetical protein